MRLFLLLLLPLLVLSCDDDERINLSGKTFLFEEVRVTSEITGFFNNQGNVRPMSEQQLAAAADLDVFSGRFGSSFGQLDLTFVSPDSVQAGSLSANTFPYDIDNNETVFIHPDPITPPLNPSDAFALAFRIEDDLLIQEIVQYVTVGSTCAACQSYPDFEADNLALLDDGLPGDQFAFRRVERVLRLEE